MGNQTAVMQPKSRFLQHPKLMQCAAFDVDEPRHLTNQSVHFEAGVSWGEFPGSLTHHVTTAPLDTLHLGAAVIFAKQH